ncbi:glycosyltransferase [Novipirellula aureliae]|uniref:glycosyltransferase n=1 Tax=Novipirellula aureliae TaxID=2527966 RepID=UPI0018CF2E47|nr:glycosyltransferase [Novipirellula aureliae]
MSPKWTKSALTEALALSHAPYRLAEPINTYRQNNIKRSDNARTPESPTSSPLSLPRLLFLTHRFVYPPNRGDRIRSYNLLRVLSENHRVTLACTNDEEVSKNDHEHVQEFCESVIIAPLNRIIRLAGAAAAVARGRSLTEGMFHSRSLSKSIAQQQRSNPFDAVLVFCSSMFPYVDTPLFSDTRMIVDLVDVDSAKWSQMGQESTWSKRPIYRFEANRVRKLEQRIADRADAVALVSEKEADLFRNSIRTDTPIIGISNGVDTDFFFPLARQAGNKRSLKGEQRSLKYEAPPNSQHLAPHSQLPTLSLIFTGVLDYKPNVEGIDWFCRQILPTLNASPRLSHSPTPSLLPPPLPISLTIVGRRPNAKVRDLAKLPGVNLVGEVPDVRPYLHGADIAISPLKLARGIQNKVLEAMASGLPVIATTQSAEGIDAQPGEELIIADTPEQWVHAIRELGHLRSQRKVIGRQARDYVVSQFSWQARLRHFDTLLEQPICRSLSS